ncbi:phosphopantetheine-binding protein [Alkalihalobacillus hemicellulosilyticus]|uniref:Long-chain-fatty-acid-CoA ligase n=1 Tax=Halalkalibacter hemicellulosilyticusJCM 9152 TaxID=1236971 RepID=W4QL43_9BACI|nr:phosphopantetheine-binding protein [Halalkalibacter hemicellulosilyticus]GAE32622.1 long-chain-fatty-acid-CoA ligase [Halalkalibacter hemicellulosilyticusJCM 9152]
MDDQIKIRGIRVELGEIKSIISNHPHIQEAVITAVSTDNYEKKIIAYIVPKSNQLDIKELRTYTQQKMPLYMVPEIFMKIKSIPLNSNGKVDRNRLPEPTSDEVRISDVNVPPTNITERKIKEVWVDILKQDNISINDNFFDVGGHSLLILQVKTKLELVFEKKIELMDLFQYPTIATLSARINNAGLDNTPFESLRAKGKDRRRALQDRRKRRENLNKQR